MRDPGRGIRLLRTRGAVPWYDIRRFRAARTAPHTRRCSSFVFALRLTVRDRSAHAEMFLPGQERCNHRRRPLRTRGDDLDIPSRRTAVHVCFTRKQPTGMFKSNKPIVAPCRISSTARIIALLPPAHISYRIDPALIAENPIRHMKLFARPHGQIKRIYGQICRIMVEWVE